MSNLLALKDQPAFPLTDQGEPIAEGLTKREYFAAMALQGLLASGAGGDKPLKVLAAIDYADELLTQLEESEQER